MTEPTTTEPQPDPPLANQQQIMFWFPYTVEPGDMEIELIRDTVALIAVMLRNGASVFELQQRLMGLDH